jgi:ubiquinone/menaquinone biosynthesis C-methylase UbiE
MTVQSERWQDQERAQRYARQTRIGTRLTYTPFARKVVQRLDTLDDEGATIVELGTGPGFLAIELHKLWPKATIIGVDPSPEMLRIARKQAAEAGMPAFEPRLGSAEDTSLPADSVDVVVSQCSFHEWVDQKKGLEEVLRILKPSGSLILADYNRAWLAPWKRKLLSLFHHLDMFVFTVEQATELLREAGFDGIEGQAQGLQWFAQATKP